MRIFFKNFMLRQAGECDPPSNVTNIKNGINSSSIMEGKNHNLLVWIVKTRSTGG